MKFSSYYRMRLYGKDPSFRKNFTYIFFLICVKERVSARSMTSIFFRKAFKGNELSAKKLKSMNPADLQKSAASYNIYTYIVLFCRSIVYYSLLNSLVFLLNVLTLLLM